MANVTEKMIEAGSKIASDLMDAHITKSLGGLKEWEEFQSNCDNSNIDLIIQYVNGEIQTVTAIYIAMNRASDI